MVLQLCGRVGRRQLKQTLVPSLESGFFILWLWKYFLKACFIDAVFDPLIAGSLIIFFEKDQRYR